ncbi:MAG: hypothetical protein K9H11_08850, partial [Rhodospirillum sp.]|nr:hypothetical protein [Rhodospirillum sp.]
TETERGLIELATVAEVITGTDTDRAVTPAGVEAWSDANPATETERGLIVLATEAEVLAGTDAGRAVTPAGLEAWSVSSPALAMARTHTDATWFHMKGESSMGGGNVYLKATGLVCDNPYVVNGEFIVPEGGAGLWVFSGYIHFPHNKAISNAYAALMVDGNANMYGSRSATNYGTYQAMSALSAIWPLDEGTRVAIGFWSEAGSEGQSLPFINFRGARIAL